MKIKKWNQEAKSRDNSKYNIRKPAIQNQYANTIISFLDSDSPVQLLVRPKSFLNKGFFSIVLLDNYFPTPS